jgi:hypothetical protein
MAVMEFETAVMLYRRVSARKEPTAVCKGESRERKRKKGIGEDEEDGERLENDEGNGYRCIERYEE